MKIPTDKRGKFKKAVKDERNHRKPNGKRKEAGRGEVSCRKAVTGGDSTYTLGITHYSILSIGPQYTRSSWSFSNNSPPQSGICWWTGIAQMYKNAWLGLPNNYGAAVPYLADLLFLQLPHEQQ